MNRTIQSWQIDLPVMCRLRLSGVLSTVSVVVLCVSISFVALVSAATEPTSIWKTTTERALQGYLVHSLTRHSMLLPVVRPLLITPGQCARFVDEELEDLTGVWPLGYCQIHFFVCIYLCGQFLKARKAAYENYRKEHWLTRRADSSRLSTQCSYLIGFNLAQDSRA